MGADLYLKKCLCAQSNRGHVEGKFCDWIGDDNPNCHLAYDIVAQIECDLAA